MHRTEKKAKGKKVDLLATTGLFKTLMKHVVRLLAAVLMGLPAWSQNLVGLKGLLPSTVDYRPYQSPVKNQASRGTCVAFSVAAVLETFDGVPSDLSEQGAYAYIKLQELGAGEISRGGLLGNYP